MTLKEMSIEELKKQGSCCGSGCKNCPYIPRHQRGSILTLESKFDSIYELKLKELRPVQP